MKLTEKSTKKEWIEYARSMETEIERLQSAVKTVKVYPVWDAVRKLPVGSATKWVVIVLLLFASWGLGRHGSIFPPIPDNGKVVVKNDEAKAKEICMKYNDTELGLTYKQRVAASCQEIVKELGWDTDKAEKFAYKYVINF